MSAKLATKPSRALLRQLESMLDEVQTPECRHWLEQELEGYSLFAPALVSHHSLSATRSLLGPEDGKIPDLSYQQSNAKPTRPGPNSVHLCP